MYSISERINVNLVSVSFILIGRENASNVVIHLIN